MNSETLDHTSYRQVALQHLHRKAIRQPEIREILSNIVDNIPLAQSRSRAEWVDLLMIEDTDTFALEDKSIMLDVLTLIQSTRHYLIGSFNEKMKIEKENFTVEHILRRTIGELEVRKNQLDGELRDKRLALSTLVAEIKRQRSESEMLTHKLKAVRQHIDAAMRGVMKEE